MLLVHGYPESSYMWHYALGALAGAGWWAIAPDLPGYGDSEPAGSGTWESHIEALDGFVRELELGPVVLVTHDWGVPIGLRWACDQPGRASALVISDGGFFADRRWHDLANVMRTPGEGEKLVRAYTREGFAAAMHAASSGMTEEAIDQYWRAFADDARRLAHLELYRSGEFDKLLPYEGRLAALELPTLIVWGEQDRFASVRMARRFHEELPAPSSWSSSTRVISCGMMSPSAAARRWWTFSGAGSSGSLTHLSNMQALIPTVKTSLDIAPGSCSFSVMHGCRWRVGAVVATALALIAIAIVPASAAAATATIKVDESSTDSTLETGSTTCKSNDALKGCTLRAAVELANIDSEEAGGESLAVEVPAATYTETLDDLAIEGGASVVIDGAGIGKTIIVGSSNGAVLEVEEGGSLTVNGVTVRGGRDYVGGGVFVDDDGSLAVESSAIEENEARAAGGGIFAGWGSVVTISKSSVDDNLAGGVEDDQGYGGGMYSSPFSLVAIEQSTIDGNKAAFSGGGIYRAAVSEFCDGVAGDLDRPGARRAVVPAGDEFGDELTIKQSTIEANTAEAGLGGGIDTQRENCEQGGTAASPAAHHYTHAASHHSWADGARPSRAARRAELDSLRPASIAESTSELTIEQSTIARNRAEAPEGSGFAGYGGGIFEGEFFFGDPIVNSTIAENFATYVGGGIADETAVEELISDTVYANAVGTEEEEEEEGSGDARHAAHHDLVVEEEGAGSNLSVDRFSGKAAMFLRDTIVAEPKGSEAENCEGPIGSLIERGGYNLDYPSDSLEEASTDTCGMSSEEEDLVGVEPKFSAEGLHDNGGPTQTIALVSSSPAIGFVPVAGNCEESEDGPGSVDQRGEHRPGLTGKGCDIGAYEYQEPPAKKETPSAPTTTTTTTTSTPAAGVSPFKIEAPAQCTSKRDITIHIQNVKQFAIVSAVVSIDGKHKRTLKGKQLETAIDLVGLPKGTFTVQIVAYTSSGHALHGKRVYHTCHTKLPGRSYIPL